MSTETLPNTHEIVDPDTLHNQESTRATILAVDVMRGHRRHHAAPALVELVGLPRRTGLDRHRSIETDELVDDLAVIVAGEQRTLKRPTSRA